MNLSLISSMSVVDKQKEIDELKAEIIAIKSNIKLSEELKLQYIDRKEEMIIILKKEIEKLSPAHKQVRKCLRLFINDFYVYIMPNL